MNEEAVYIIFGQKKKKKRCKALTTKNNLMS